MVDVDLSATSKVILAIDAALSDWRPDGREGELVKALRGTADMIEAKGLRCQWEEGRDE